MGWFPLGWHDPYIPSYYVSPAYARNVNISNSRAVNVTVINNYYSTTNVNIRNTAINNIRYENAGVHGAVTGVSNSTFASGKPVRGNFVVVPASAVGRTSVMTNASVVPTKAAVLGGRAPSNVPQHIVAPRQIASRVAPPPRPVTFEQQRPLLEKSNGVPLAPTVRANIRATNPPPPARGGQPAASQNGARLPARNVPTAPQQIVPPANANQAPANQNSAPVRNVPRPSQPTGSTSGQLPAMRPAETPNRPVTLPTPAREAAPVQPQRNAAPAQPQHTSAPAPAQPPRSATPAQPQRTTPTAAPVQNHKAPPPAKENKNENKNEDKNREKESK